MNSEPRVHTVRITPDALKRLVDTCGAKEVAQMVRDMVIDAGLGQSNCVWEGGKGRGITVRGLTSEKMR